VLVRGAAHVIIYHLLCEGHAWVELEDSERVMLSAGDLIALPHGHAHKLGSGRQVTPIDAGSSNPGVLERKLELLTFGGGGRLASSSAATWPAILN
jgi:hypothetical protein